MRVSPLCPQAPARPRAPRAGLDRVLREDVWLLPAVGGHGGAAAPRSRPGHPRRGGRGEAHGRRRGRGTVHVARVQRVHLAPAPSCSAAPACIPAHPRALRLVVLSTLARHPRSRSLAPGPPAGLWRWWPSRGPLEGRAARRLAESVPVRGFYLSAPPVGRASRASSPAPVWHMLRSHGNPRRWVRVEEGNEICRAACTLHLTCFEHITSDLVVVWDPSFLVL